MFGTASSKLFPTWLTDHLLQTQIEHRGLTKWKGKAYAFLGASVGHDSPVLVP